MGSRMVKLCTKTLLLQVSGIHQENSFPGYAHLEHLQQWLIKVTYSLIDPMEKLLIPAPWVRVRQTYYKIDLPRHSGLSPSSQFSSYILSMLFLDLHITLLLMAQKWWSVTSVGFSLAHELTWVVTRLTCFQSQPLFTHPLSGFFSLDSARFFLFFCTYNKHSKLHPTAILSHPLTLRKINLIIKD